MKQQFTALIFLMMFASCSNKLQTGLTKNFIHAGPGYSKAVAIANGNVKTIYVSGLTGEGVDLEAQTRSTFANVKIELEAAGATFKDVVKMNTYIVNCNPGKVAIFRSIRKEILGENEMPASTLLGVPVLASPDKLIEIEVIAVIEKLK